MGRDRRAEIAKEFHWEMGHRLPFHEGGCRNVHGHSYHMVVTVEGRLDENGMVVDYFDIKAVIEPVVEMIDHAFLCDESDETMLSFLVQHDMKHVTVPFPTTAENIAAWLLEQVVERLQRYPNVERVGVRLHETERTYAEIRRPIRSS